MPKPLKTFIIYAREDAIFKNELLRQLAPFVQNGLLEKWDDSHILPGEEWEKTIEKALETSQLVLMLVSADSLFSDFIQRKELKKALERKQEGITRIVPILVRDCLYDMAQGISELQMLPLHPVSRSLVPVDELTTWGSRASAWASALRQLREVINDVHSRIEEDEKLAALAAELRIAEEAEAALQRKKEKEEQSRAKILRNKDEAAWKVAQELDTIEAFESYLEKGYNIHETAAHDRITALEAAEAKRRVAEKKASKAKQELALKAEINEVEKEIQAVIAQKNSAVQQQRYEDAANLRHTQSLLMRKFEKAVEALKGIDPEYDHDRSFLDKNTTQKTVSDDANLPTTPASNAPPVQLKFTNALKLIISNSKAIADKLSHEYVGTEHVLLGILNDKEGLPMQVFNQLSVNIDSLQQKLERSIPRYSIFPLADNLTAGNIPMDKQVERILKGTFLESRLMQSDEIAPEHVMLSILKNTEYNEALSDLLKTFNLDYMSFKNGLGHIKSTNK